MKWGDLIPGDMLVPIHKEIQGMQAMFLVISQLDNDVLLMFNMYVQHIIKVDVSFKSNVSMYHVIRKEK